MEELRVSIVADASGLGPGLASATEQVQAAATTMAEAQTIATEATKNLAAAQAQLGAAAEGGNAQAKAILSQYTIELAAAKAQLAQVTAAESQETVATKALAGATAQATTATQAFTAAQSASNGVTYAGISSRQAATASIGLLEGRMMSSNRAAGAFLATTLGLGPVLQAAFPIIGAVAMVGVLADVAKGVAKLASEASDLSEELGIGWLDAAIGQLTGLGDKVKELDKQILGFQEHAHTFAEQTAQVGLSIVGQEFGSAEEATQRSLAAKSEAETLRASLPLMEQRLRIEKEVASYQGFSKTGLAHYGAEAELRGRAEAAGVTTSPNLAVKEAENTQAFIEQQTAKINLLEAQASELALKAGEIGKVDKTKKGPEDNLPQEIARAQIEAAHSMDAELDPAQRITAELVKQVELNRVKADYSKSGTAVEKDTLLALENQQAVGKSKLALHELESDVIDRSFKEQIEQSDRAAKEDEEGQKQSAEAYRQKRQVAIDAARDGAQATVQAAEQDFTSTERNIRLQEQLGIVTHRVATQRLLDASRKEEGAVTGALGKEQGIFDPALGAKEAVEFEQLQEKITAEARKGALQREQITQQETLKIAQQYKRVATEFNTDFTRAFNEWATKSQTAGQAFGHMLGQMELQVIDFVAKWLLEQAEMWAMQKILQATGLADQHAKQAAGNSATVLGDAGVAAANTMAYYTAIDPPVAPAMAAIAFAETQSYGTAAAFEYGGIVSGAHGQPVPIVAHAGERVLSAGQTSNFESLVNNGGSRTATLNQENHFGGGVTEEMLQAHTQQTMQQLRSMLRPEAFV